MLREPFEQSDGCHLRINHDRKAADIGDLFRRNVHAAAKLVRARGGAIDIVYADISEPARPKPRLRRVRGQAHQAGNRAACNGKERIGHVRGRCVLRAPAHHIGVEGPSAFHVRRDQLVPEKTAV